MTITEIIVETARKYGVDPRLAVELAIAESNLNQSAVSSAGAIGVMQLMPATAAALGVNPYDLRQNIDGGVRYLKQQLDRFGDVAKALAAYNCGPGCVLSAITAAGAEWLTRVPSETRSYVSRILSRLGDWQAGPVIPLPPDVQRAADTFLSLSRPAQTIVLVLAVVMGVYLLSEAVE